MPPSASSAPIARAVVRPFGSRAVVGPRATRQQRVHGAEHIPPPGESRHCVSLGGRWTSVAPSRLTRRELIAGAAAAAGALVLLRRGDTPPPRPARDARAHAGRDAHGHAGHAAPEPGLKKLIDIGPGGVIAPGSAQDYRFHSNPTYFADTRTRWIRMWADWPTPAARRRPRDRRPRQPRPGEPARARRADRPRERGRALGDPDALPLSGLGERDGRGRRRPRQRRRGLLPVLGPHDRGVLAALPGQRPPGARLRPAPRRPRVPAARRGPRPAERVGALLRVPLRPLRRRPRQGVRARQRAQPPAVAAAGAAAGGLPVRADRAERAARGRRHPDHRPGDLGRPRPQRAAARPLAERHRPGDRPARDGLRRLRRPSCSTRSPPPATARTRARAGRTTTTATSSTARPRCAPAR